MMVGSPPLLCYLTLPLVSKPNYCLGVIAPHSSSRVHPMPLTLESNLLTSYGYGNEIVTAPIPHADGIPMTIVTILLLARRRNREEEGVQQLHDGTHYCLLVTSPTLGKEEGLLLM